MAVEVERLDGAGIAERGGNLCRFGRKLRSQTLAHAQYFQEIAAIVRPQRIGLDTNTGDQIFGVRRENYLAQAFLALRRRNLQPRVIADCSAHGFTRTASVFFVRVSATRLAARSSDSNVPASVHHPLRWADRKSTRLNSSHL